MTAHDQNEAIASRITTILTIVSAWRKRLGMERSWGTAPPRDTASILPCMSRDHPSFWVAEGGQRRLERGRQRRRPAASAETGDLRGETDERGAVALDV